jgi:hypothetical protein
MPLSKKKIRVQKLYNLYNAMKKTWIQSMEASSEKMKNMKGKNRARDFFSPRA